MVRVVVASDKFKGSLTSAEVAAAVGAGVRRVHPDATVVPVPVADGGDGTLAAAVAAGYELVPLTASGPTGEPVATAYARLGDTAVVELADVSGLVRLPEASLAPMTATSYGTGELMAAAVEAGCTRVILGIGGSASTDGGRGLVEALTGTGLDLGSLRRRLRGVQVVVACDVDNPLTGPRGAAAVYGPQKGATPEQVVELDGRLGEWADLVAQVTGRDLRDTPGAGAAGGVGFAAVALLGAELRPGIELVLEMVGFEEQLAGADLVITGEGALDEQTLHGKAVAGVAAKATGIPVVAVCGVNRLEHHELQQAGVQAAYALTDLEPDVQRCIAEPKPLLEQLGERIAVEHLTMTRRERGIA
ncbi:glycerate kinase [Kribbella jiaozuonensis]|uniref:Glycerate kinase n=1 Tax=Kribbella jiaozuonensis TaxID=2575441 RepID=A0A4U3LQM8_9ACTN|nr:glycerate kinase [Kribbella jiaozuonensis]TKK77424.1 glycerate kinase [Kribbella jiaozuonensis]